MATKNQKNEEKRIDRKELTLCLDFREYPDLYQRLQKAARIDFRTPELEVLWLLNKYLPTEGKD